MFLYLFTIDVFLNQVKMLLFSSVQTTNLTMLVKNEVHSRQL